MLPPSKIPEGGVGIKIVKKKEIYQICTEVGSNLKTYFPALNANYIPYKYS
jgi:hypothetical protein